MKCPICKTKKGKRPCKMTTTCICSVCCGTNRNKICEGCSFYQSPRRNYKDIPYYSPNEMDGYKKREDISEVIEGALTTFDYATDDQMNDIDAIQIIERLLDFYYFQEPAQNSENSLADEGFNVVFNSMQKHLAHVDHNEISKILGALRYVAKRRTTGRREYLHIIRQYVGIDFGDGASLRMFPKS